MTKKIPKELFQSKSSKVKTHFFLLEIQRELATPTKEIPLDVIYELFWPSFESLSFREKLALSCHLGVNTRPGSDFPWGRKPEGLTVLKNRAKEKIKMVIIRFIIAEVFFRLIVNSGKNNASKTGTKKSLVKKKEKSIEPQQNKGLRKPQNHQEEEKINFTEIINS